MYISEWSTPLHNPFVVWLRSGLLESGHDLNLFSYYGLNMDML